MLRIYTLTLILSSSATGWAQWEKIAITESSQVVRAVTVGDGWWGAITDNGTMLRSQDAKTWQSWKPAKPSSGSGSVDLEACEIGGGLFVAVGRQTSPNQSVIATWPLNAPTGTAASFVTTIRFYSIHYARGEFTAGGANGSLFTRSTGGAWTPLPNLPSTQDAVFGIAYGSRPGLYVAVEGDRVWTSANRTTWAAAQYPSGIVGSWAAVTHVGNQYIAVGNAGRALDGVVIWSTDGRQWNRKNAGELGLSDFRNLSGVGGGAGQFFITSALTARETADVRLWVSRDFQKWQGVLLAPAEELHGIAYNGWRFLAVGSAGTGFLSSEVHGFEYLRLGRGQPSLLDFRAGAGKQFRVRKSSDLQNWEIITEFDGQGQLMEITDPTPHPHHQFYEVTSR